MANSYPKKLLVGMTEAQYNKVKSAADSLDCTMAFLLREMVDSLKATKKGDK